jgi:TonB family protein
MNAQTLPTLLDWVHALGWTLLHFLWQGALIGAGYALARLLARGSSPQVRYTLGLVALALLACAPAITLWQLAPVATISALSGVATALPAMAATAGAAHELTIEPWLPWLVGAWLLGVSAVSLRNWAQYWRLRNLVRREATALPQWEARLTALVRRFGVSRPVRLVQSAIVQTPSMIGWLAPVIVLPASVLVGLTPRQLELVIAHELGHIRRWDFLVNVIQIALESVLFYHPVVHWISREVRNEREACCDDLVLRLGADPVDYAKTLASLEELRGVTHAPALAVSGGLLLGRIRRIVGAEPMFAAPLSSGQGLLLLVVAFAALMAFRPMAGNVLDAVTTAAPQPPTIARDAVAPPARLATSAGVADVLTRSAALVMERGLSPAPVAEAPVDAATPGVATPRIARTTAPLSPPGRAVDSPRIVDLAFAAPALPRIGTPSRAAAAPRPLERAAPEYPARATLEGIEGSVTLSFVVDGDGVAREIRVVAANEPGWFEGAAMAALRAWRFEPGLALDRYTQTFDFSLGLDSDSAAEREPCERRVGSRLCRNLPVAAMEPITTLGEIPR